MERLSWEQVSSYIKSFDCELISKEYKNNHSKLEIKYSCGCIGYNSYLNFKNGQRCRFHQREKASRKRRMSVDNIKKDIKNRDFIFVEIIGEHIGRETIVAYLCSLRHRTEKRYNDFANHPNCRICEMEKRRFRYAFKPIDIENIVNSMNCTLIKIEYYKNRKNSRLEIEFSCNHREHLSLANFQGRKTGLCVECEMKNRSGETAYCWKGGFTPLTICIRKNLSDWNEDCARLYNYKCIITGKPMEHVHHLQSFNLILYETMRELDFGIKKNVLDYSEKELENIINKFLEIQLHYPMGIPISAVAHHTFHKYYGRGNNTPDQFYDFQNKIKSGEILMPES